MQARGRCSSRGDGKMNDAKRTANRDTVTLTDNSTGKSLELPVLSGSVGPRAIDVSRLYAETGCFTYRSEEHTSELQSLMRISYAVFCLKKKNKQEINNQKT